jgi:hypothetical protein
MINISAEDQDHEIELRLYELMYELQNISNRLEIEIAPHSAIVEEKLKTIEAISEPYSKKCSDIQDEIKKLSIIRAKSLKTGSGNITYRKGGVRRKWDLDMLDNTCEDNEYIKEKIWKYRKEEQFEPQVLIKLEKEGKSVTEL